MIRQWIDRAASQRGGAPYLEDGASARSVTYTGLRRAAGAWADRLDRAGVRAGARVVVDSPDPLRYATALVGLLAAGRVAVPLDPAAPPAEQARVLAVARPAAAVRDGGGRRPPEVEPLDGPNEPGSAGPGGIFLCTSGTTGTPKGILLASEQLAHVAGAVASHHRLTAADRGHCCLPLFHVNAEVVGLLATLAAGACLVVDRKFSRRGFWPQIEAREITWVNAVPAIITVLAMDPPASLPPASRVRFVRSASAPLPPSVLRRFEAAFGLPVVETYGMTEAASMITANPLDGPRKPGSAGRPAGAEVRVVTRLDGGRLDGGRLDGGRLDGGRLDGCRGVPCPAGTVGRVQIRGRGVIRRYASGGAPGVIDSEGWLDTGDLGHLDEDGYLFLAGRSDDVINRGGEKIYPREIEDFLLAQPGVWTAVVVGTRDEVLGERPVAYVIPAGVSRPGQLEETLRGACEEGLPRAKRPSAFRLVEELPLGPTGKVSRRRLRELAAAPDGGLVPAGAAPAW